MVRRALILLPNPLYEVVKLLQRVGLFSAQLELKFQVRPALL